ncbi:hypothetical protein ACFYE2_06605 [Kocuria sp. CPCC 205300]|uniref:hypothetical protein n=1 Tax=Kocuria sabuli TaxID=3071448 RepID=UPI0036DE55AE
MSTKRVVLRLRQARNASCNYISKDGCVIPRQPTVLHLIPSGVPMPCPTSVPRGRLLVLAALAGTTAVTGALATAVPAVAAPVAVEGYIWDIPEDTSTSGAGPYINAVVLTNGDTAYGIHEDQPLTPVGETMLDDESYTVAEPFDDPEAGLQHVIGEKVGDHGVYWTPENAALAGYVLSVFGPTEDPDEALAVHWAVRSLSTAADRPLPELPELEQSHLDRAAFMVEDARSNVPSMTPQADYRISLSVEPDGRPDRLLVQMPESYYATTVTLSGPVTFVDGTTTQTFTGGDRNKYLELAVPAGITEGGLTVDLTATMPSTELIVLADGQYRDLLIAGQDRTISWGASAGFEIEASAEPTPPTTDAADPDDALPDSIEDDDTTADKSDGTTADTTAAAGPASVTDDDLPGDPADGGTNLAAIPHEDDPGSGGGDLLVANAPDTRTTAVVEAFVLFDERIETQTHVLTETTVTTGGLDGAAYATSVTADTGMGAAGTTGSGNAVGPAVLGAVAVAAGLGAWLLHRRRPTAPTE